MDNSEKRIIYDRVKAVGHPDSLGFMARIDIESGFDENKVGDDGRIGLSQVDPKDVEDFGIDDLDTISGNTDAALALDLINFDKNNDLSEMYALFRHYKGKKAKDYNDKIDSKRKAIEEELFGGEESSANEEAYSVNRAVDSDNVKSMLGISASPLFRDPSTELVLTIMELIDRV